MTKVNWQPHLFGTSLRLRPLIDNDFNALFAVASDPLIWELHPDRMRYTRERFEIYFRSGIESQGALAVIDLKSGKIIGSSRYTSHNPQTSSVEIGFTFLTRDKWGGTYNRELKTLMLNYAFQHVETAYFVVGRDNLRSRRAMTKIGGLMVTDLSATPVTERSDPSVVFQIAKENWIKGNATPIFIQPTLNTPRLTLEPIVESHAQELWELFGDLRLHEYVPYEPLSLEKQRERCARWAERRSPDGTELWLNWAGRDLSSGKVMAHFQVGAKVDGTASIGYLIARDFQGKGLATEGLEAIFAYLGKDLGVREVKAWTDTRNEASHRLAKKLGMVQVGLIKNADFFKNAASDEYVFSKVLQ